MSIRNLVENKTKLDYQAITTSLIGEFGISDPINWDAVIPANVQHNLFGGETLRLFDDHPNFATQKDVRTITLKKGQTSQLLILFAKLKDEKLSKSNIEKVTKKFIGGSAAERFVVWFLGNPSNTEFKVVLSGREGKKIVLKTLPFGINQPYYKTYDFILEEVHKKVAQLFVEPNELWKALWKSFDISVVNKKFYLDIKSAFDSLINDNVFKGSIRIEEARKQFAVRLIGRIIFSWFLKKKNIIAEAVLSSNAISKYDNYYLEFLEKLFFEVFNTPQKERGHLPDEIKDYPFLNGGLFEAQEGDYGDYRGKVIINNDWFIDLFKNTLEKYNFTIDENTSASSEIAIDPEMLGRIFENLLAEQNPETQESARKSTGSYYTPREIVDYMVEQSISEYLKSNVTLSLSKGGTTDVIASEVQQSFEQALEDFVHTEEFHDNLKPYSTQILEKLNVVKILDPACGSGAFPIGMLQKLIALKLQLSPFTKRGTQGGSKGVSVYDLKLQTILNSIYGCDIQPMAVELSRLRCWLSLIIDEDVDKKKSNWNIESLPNLDFKFVCANTLISLQENDFDTGNIFDDTYDQILQLKNQLKEIRLRYFDAKTKKQKEELRKLDFTAFHNLLELVKKDSSFAKNAKLVLSFKPYDLSSVADFFDPDWMFGIKEGFDIVLGNPPYVFTRTADFTKEFKKYVNDYYFSQIKSTIKSKAKQSGKINLFGLFIMRGLMLLKANAFLNFIVPNNLLRTTTFDNIRKYILDVCRVIDIVDLGSGVFDKVTASTIVINLQRTSDDDTRNSNKINVISSINDFVNRDYSSSHISQSNFLKNVSYSFNLYIDDRAMLLNDKIRLGKKPFGSFCIDIIEGIVAHSHLIVEQRKKDYLPLLEGKCIKKYAITPPHKFIKWSTNEIHRTRPDYLWAADKKIILQRISGGSNPLTASLDTDRNKTFASINNILLKAEFSDAYEFYLALLNSRVLNWYYANNYSNNSELTVNISKTYLEHLPVPIYSPEIHSQIDDLVSKIILKKKSNYNIDTKDLEDKLDIMVYKLYNLTYEEVKIIDPEIEKIISKEEYEKFQLEK